MNPDYVNRALRMMHSDITAKKIELGVGTDTSNMYVVARTDAGVFKGWIPLLEGAFFPWQVADMIVVQEWNYGV